MKALLSLVVVLMIGCFAFGKTSAQSTYAISDYQSGYIAAMCAAGITSDADEATWNCP